MMDQKLKKQLAPGIRKVLKKYGMKGTIAVSSRFSLRVNLHGGKIDLIGNHIEAYRNSKQDEHDTVTKENIINTIKESNYKQVYSHHALEDNFSGEALEFMTELREAMNVGNWNESGEDTVCFGSRWFDEIFIGRIDRPFQYEG